MQERQLGGLLAVWLTAAASAGIKLPGAGAGGAGPALLQQGASKQLKPLLPPFFDELVLVPQLSTLKDGRWGLLDGHLAWQACPAAPECMGFCSTSHGTCNCLADIHLDSYKVMLIILVHISVHTCQSAFAAHAHFFLDTHPFEEPLRKAGDSSAAPRVPGQAAGAA